MDRYIVISDSCNEDELTNYMLREIGRRYQYFYMFAFSTQSNTHRYLSISSIVFELEYVTCQKRSGASCAEEDYF